MFEGKALLAIRVLPAACGRETYTHATVRILEEGRRGGEGHQQIVPVLCFQNLNKAINK